jgi:hypothetical protein
LLLGRIQQIVGIIAIDTVIKLLLS